MGARRPRSRAIAGFTFMLVLLCAGVALVWILLDRGLATAADWAQLVSVPLATVPLVVMLIRWWRRGSLPPTTPDQLDLAERKLAEIVLDQWRQEIRLRRLDDPAPQGVRWRLTELDRVMDHAKNVLRSNPLSFLLLGWGKLRLSGTSDRADQMVEQYRKLDHRRLVILGGPGMGKTTLAVLLVRALLETPEAGDPVPVLLTLSSWEPDQEPFRAWLSRRVAETYPALRATAFGAEAPGALVSGQRILPVLDGLDELPESARSRTIATLNAAMTATDQLILTCRTEEYVAAVTAPEGDVVTGGAVIEPQPLRPAEVVAYLERCVPPGRAGWPRLLRRLKTEPDSALAEALNTPLALWLLRKVYVDGHREPSPLLDTAVFPTADAITDHLLDNLVDTVVDTEPVRQRWKPANAQRWLGFLADHLDKLGTRDLAWWRLGRSAGTSGEKLSVRVGAPVPTTVVLSMWSALLIFVTPGPPLLVGAAYSIGFLSLAFGFVVSGHADNLVPPDDSYGSPRSTLNHDLFSMGLNPALGALVALGTSILFDLSLEMIGAAVLFGSALGGVVWLGLTAGGIYFADVVALFFSRRAPWRLMTFLEDMHRLGLLRQVGPVYQFRHAKLQDRLAAAYRAGRIE